MNKNHDITLWVNMYTSDLLQWAQQRVSDVALSEDLVQETFLSAYRGYENFENRSTPKSWLISILNRKIADYYRSKHKLNYIQTDFMEESQANILTESLFNNSDSWHNINSGERWDSDEHLLDNPEFNAVMTACMNDLPSKWKYVVTSKYIDNKNANEICQEIELTQSNYWQMIHRAKLLLKVCIEKYWK